MKLFKQDYMRILLLNSCFLLIWGCGSSGLLEEAQLASTADEDSASWSVPFRIQGVDDSKAEAPPAKEVVEDDADAPAPSIVYSLDQVDKFNRPASLLEFHNMTGNRCDSADCEKLRNMKYQQCDARNSYLEKEMTALSSKTGLMARVLRAPINPKSIIKPVCMRMSMEAKFGASSKSFRQCTSNGKSSRAYRPCISENYFKLVTNSFNLVSTCMKDYMAPGESSETQNLDVRAAYAMINIESGFHVNAMSGTGAGGIGQMTSAAISDSNSSEMRKIRIALENHKDPACNALSHELLDSAQPMRADSKNSCDRVSISRGNPMLNMVYTYAYMKWSKNAMERVVLNDKRYKGKFRLSNYDMERVKRALMVWSHNTGPAGTWTPAMTLLNTMYRNKPVTNADVFINELQQYMKRFPARANRSSARRTETSKYFPSITNLLNQIETSVGGGSCVN